jgi:hypothetical protein
MMNSPARKTDPEDGRRPFGTSSRMDRWNRGASIPRDQTLHALEIFSTKPSAFPAPAFDSPSTRLSASFPAWET